MQNIYDQAVEYIVASQEKLYRMAYTYVGSKEAALDVVQNTICKVLEKIDNLTDVNALGAWVHRILVNEGLMYIKKYKKEILSDPLDNSYRETGYDEKGYDVVISEESRLYKQVQKLPMQQKTVIVLHFYEQLTLKEISKITQTSESTVKSRLYAAINKLKCNVKEEFE